jgi:hypothetical protein
MLSFSSFVQIEIRTLIFKNCCHDLYACMYVNKQLLHITPYDIFFFFFPLFFDINYIECNVARIRFFCIEYYINLIIKRCIDMILCTIISHYTNVLFIYRTYNNKVDRLLHTAKFVTHTH